MKNTNRFNPLFKPPYKVLFVLMIVATFVWVTPGLLQGNTGLLGLAQPVAAASDPVIAAAGDIACDPASSAFNGGLGNSNSCRQKYTSDLLVNAGLGGGARPGR